MIKSLIIRGVLTGLLSTVIGFIYTTIYYDMIVDFSEVVNIYYLLSNYFTLGMGFSLIGILLSFISKNNKILEFIFNIIISLSAFAIVLIVLKMNEPVFKNEETNLFIDYYKGFIMPLIFFPALTWFSLQPFFKSK